MFATYQVPTIFPLDLKREELLHLNIKAVTDDRSEARVDPLAALLVQGQNRQISGRGVEGNVEKAESKTETEQWVRAGGRQRGLP